MAAKAGAGRPAVLKHSAVMSVVLEQTTKDTIESIADREGKTVSEYLRPYLEEIAKNHASGNDSFVLTKWVDEPKTLAMPTMGEILKPGELDMLEGADLELLGKAARGRVQEIEAAMKRRGWKLDPHGSPVR